MRRRARIDSNQNEVVKYLRRRGASVAITSALGKGFPDIVVGYLGVNLLIEIKDGSKPPSQRKLTEDELRFQSEWNGAYYVVEDVEDCEMLLDSINSRASQI